jgi:WD40 repeat protein
MEIYIPNTHGRTVATALSPNKRHLAVATPYCVSCFDLQKNTCIALPPPTVGGISQLVWDVSGTTLAAGTQDGVLLQYHFAKSISLATTKPHRAVTALIAHPKNGFLSGGSEGALTWTSTHDKPTVSAPYPDIMQKDGFGVTDIATHPSGAIAVTYGQTTKNVRLFSLTHFPTSPPLFSIGGGALTRVAWAPNGDRLVCATETTAVVIDATKGNVLHRFFFPKKYIKQLVWTKPETFLISFGDGAVIEQPVSSHAIPIAPPITPPITGFPLAYHFATRTTIFETTEKSRHSYSRVTHLCSHWPNKQKAYPAHIFPFPRMENRLLWPTEKNSTSLMLPEQKQKRLRVWQPSPVSRGTPTKKRFWWHCKTRHSFLSKTRNTAHHFFVQQGSHAYSRYTNRMERSLWETERARRYLIAREKRTPPIQYGITEEI